MHAGLFWRHPHPWLEPVTAPDDRHERGQTEQEAQSGATEGPDRDAQHAASKPEGRGRARPFDRRTLALCVLVALVAALLAGIIAARSPQQASETTSDAILRDAEDLPDMALPSLDSAGEVDLAGYRGTPLVVNFWGSWCQPCVREMPAFEQVHASLGDTVAFLGVNVNDSEEAARSMAERTGVTYDLVRDVDGRLGRALAVTTFPTTVLVLPDGTIIDTVRREMSAERLCEKINQSLLNRSLEECG